MKLNKIRETILAGALGLASLTGCATYQVPEMGKPLEEKPVVELKGASLETGVEAESKIARYRLFTDVDVNIGDWIIGYRGFNSVSGTEKDRSGDSETHFGAQRFLIGPKDGSLFGRVHLETTNANDEFKVQEKYFGLRDFNLAKAIGCYGWVDVLSNQDRAKIIGFLGKDLGKGFSLEATQGMTSPYSRRDGERRSTFTELQLNKNLWKHLGAFVRAEGALGSGSYRVKEDTRFVLGLEWSW